MYDKWIVFVNKLNSLGIPLPMAKDPTSGRGSVSLTMVVVSFCFCILGIIGKWNKVVGIDYSEAFNLFIACSSLYFGRKLSKSGNNISIDSKEEKDDK